MSDNDSPLSTWQKIKLVVRVIEVRLRFILVLVATALGIGYWDTIKNYVEKWTRPAEAAEQTLPADQEFYCPMHPQVVRNGLEPNGEVPKCPICGMPLSLRTKGQLPALARGVTGRVQLSPDRIQLAGIQTALVEYRPLSKQITTVGNVTYDESRLSRVVSRVGGYVEKLYINKTFTLCKEGEPLAEIYSPDLYSAGQEMLSASQRTGSGTDLAASVRQRLRLLGVSDEEIRGIVQSGRATPLLVIRSPQHGYVMLKDIVKGARVEPGMTLLEVADLSTVWIEAEVYEKDLPFLREGQSIEATVESLPGRVFSGKVSLIYPRVETATRTIGVRFQVDNRQNELRPGMFATVAISTPMSDIEPFKSMSENKSMSEKLPSPSGRGAGGEGGSVTGPPSVNTPTAAGPHPNPLPKGEGTDVVALPKGEGTNESLAATSTTQSTAGGRGQPGVLAVPERAVVDTGTKQVVYVERQPGVFEGVQVQLGPRAGEMYPVIKGLQAGDRVAAAGAFLIDAETRLNPAAASTYFGASGGPQTSAARPAVAPSASTGAETGHSPGASAETNEPKSSPTESAAESDTIRKNLAALSPKDRELALAQGVCPITDSPLGSMGPPLKIIIKDQVIFVCCSGCKQEALENPQKTLQKVARLKAAKKSPPDDQGARRP